MQMQSQFKVANHPNWFDKIRCYSKCLNAFLLHNRGSPTQKILKSGVMLRCVLAAKSDRLLEHVIYNCFLQIYREPDVSAGHPCLFCRWFPCFRRGYFICLVASTMLWRLLCTDLCTASAGVSASVGLFSPSAPEAKVGMLALNALFATASYI
jgi:hypothetical protein